MVSRKPEIVSKYPAEVQGISNGTVASIGCTGPKQLPHNSRSVRVFLWCTA